MERQQVYVRSKIIELSDTKTREVGVKYGIQGATANGGGLYSFSAAMGGAPIAISDRDFLSFISIPNIREGLAIGAAISLLSDENAANLLSERFASLSKQSRVVNICRKDGAYHHPINHRRNHHRPYKKQLHKTRYRVNAKGKTKTLHG